MTSPADDAASVTSRVSTYERWQRDTSTPPPTDFKGEEEEEEESDVSSDVTDEELAGLGPTPTESSPCPSANRYPCPPSQSCSTSTKRTGCWNAISFTLYELGSAATLPCPHNWLIDEFHYDISHCSKQAASASVRQCQPLASRLGQVLMKTHLIRETCRETVGCRLNPMIHLSNLACTSRYSQSGGDVW